MPTTHAARRQYDVSGGAGEWTIVDSVVPEDCISIVTSHGARADSTAENRYAREQTAANVPAMRFDRFRFSPEMHTRETPSKLIRFHNLTDFRLRLSFYLVLVLIPIGLSIISVADRGHVLLVGSGLAIMWLGFMSGVLGVYGIGLKTGYYFLQPRRLILVLAVCMGLAVSAIWSAIRLASD